MSWSAAPATRDDGSERPRRSTGLVPVVFQVAAGLAEHAELVAEFTSWTPLAMDRRPDGHHTTTVLLRPGASWHYRFLLDGEEIVNDPFASRYEAIGDGTVASVVEVEFADR